MYYYQFSAGFLIAVILGVAGCTPHSDPMKEWKLLGTLSSAAVPETIKQDAQAYFQTLPQEERNRVQFDYALEYHEDGTGQHAVTLECPHDGECWYYALIYDRDNRRIKLLKYSTNSYMS